MQITMLGAGKIGGTLGGKWAQAGHTIRYGVRDPQKPEVLELLGRLGGTASASTIAEAIPAGDVVVFALPGVVMADTVAHNASALDGKTIIDTANNMRAATVNSMAAFAAHAPHASVYRAFNSYGWEMFENPIFDDTAADLFYCGTDGDRRSVVEQLIADVGLRPIYLGGVEQAELVDDVLRLWFALASGQKMGRRLAFKVLTR